ncbi:MAG: pilus (MSHA type) biogenesis protein MshL [Proteobacteria bacterium]|nr:MAG: pilus (MSHA type) biogenesis protein MshL [Pseudomonadota bacterium]
MNVKRLQSQTPGYLLAVVLLFGCAENPMRGTGLNTNVAVDTSTISHIGEVMDDALAEPEASVNEVPEQVSLALIPELAPAGSQPETEERFDLSVSGASAQSFFRDLVRGTDYNVVVHPDVAATISIELGQVTIPEVIDIVTKTWGLVSQTEGQLVKILPGGLQTEVFQINYLNISRKGDSNTRVNSGQISSMAVQGGGSGSISGGQQSGVSGSSGTSITTTNTHDFWAELKEMLVSIVGEKGGRRVVTNPYAGIVVVKAMPDQLAMVRELLGKADLIMQRQVILEAKILEVTLSEGYQQGLQWSGMTQLGHGKNAAGAADKYLSGDLSSRAVTDEAVEGVFSAALRIHDFSTVIQLLGRQGNVQVLSSPRISTVNNQKAVIKVGTDEFFVTNVDIDDSNGSDSDRTSTDVELTPFFSGISLDVTPQIGDDGNIILHVHPSISEVQDQQKVISLGDRTLTLPMALSTIRETDSVISAENGKIVVIGGLIQHTNREDNASTPLLGDIPLLGEAFKQKRQSGQKSELVILLKPMITSRETFRGDVEKSRSRLKSLGEVLSSPPEPTLW